MELQYREAPGMLYDCLQMMSMKLNDKMIWIPRLASEEKIEEDISYFNYWLEQFDTPDEELLLFFHCSDIQKQQFMMIQFSDFMYKKGGKLQFDDFIRYMEDRERFRLDVLTYYLEKPITEVEDMEEGIRKKKGLPDRIKFFLLGFIVNTDKYLQILKRCFEDYYWKMKEIYRKSAADLIEWTEMIDGNSLRTIYNTYDAATAKEENLLEGKITFSIAVIQRNSTYYGVEGSEKWFVLGYDYARQVKKDEALRIDIGTLGNALGDKHRKAILRYILEAGEQTSGELAKKLGIAINTVSYHLDIMRKANLICTRSAGKTVYYWPNYRTFHAVAELFERMARGECRKNN